MFTFFTDRDGKYQLAALAESGFDPLARTCRFMLTEEAHHMFVGETGVQRVAKRACELMKQDPNGDVRCRPTASTARSACGRRCAPPRAAS
jgi:benzoyl-CoA 2,3-dioxygenase component B